jgi:hypothetical protein
MDGMAWHGCMDGWMDGFTRASFILNEEPLLVLVLVLHQIFK